MTTYLTIPEPRGRAARDDPKATMDNYLRSVLGQYFRDATAISFQQHLYDVDGNLEQCIARIHRPLAKHWGPVITLRITWSDRCEWYTATDAPA